jgi:hypothetical protein
MPTFNIDADNNITALGSQQADFECEIFANQKELADLAAKWPANRLIEFWNRIPGLTPVKKFTDRKSAVRPHLESDPEPGRRRRDGSDHDGPEAGQQG